MTTVAHRMNLFAEMPVEPGPLTKHQTNLIHKRLCKEALNPTERLRHHVFMRRIFNENHPIHARPNLYSAFYHEKFARVHKINGSLFYDLTKVGAVRVSRSKPQMLGWKTMYLYFADKMQNLDIFYFGKEYFTNFGLVLDGEQKDQIVIDELEVPRAAGAAPRENAFVVDTRYHLIVEHQDSQKQVVSVPYYIARNEVDPLESSCYSCSEIAETLPVDDSLLSDDEKMLVNAVVTGTILESEQHDQLLQSNAAYKTVFTEKLKRIHRFPGDKHVILIDRTAKGVAGTAYAQEFKYDAITLKGHIVFIPKCERGVLRRFHYTRDAPGCINFITVADTEKPNHVVITEFVLPGRETETIFRKSLVDLSDSNLQVYSNGTKKGYHSIPISEPSFKARPRVEDGEEKELSSAAASSGQHSHLYDASPPAVGAKMKPTRKQTSMEDLFLEEAIRESLEELQLQTKKRSLPVGKIQ